MVVEDYHQLVTDRPALITLVSEEGGGTVTEAVMAIDQGTTGSTAMVFGHEGQILGRAYSEINQHYPKPGWVEHDPEEIWRVSLRVMAQAL